MQSAGVVDLINEAGKVLSDVGEGFIGHRIDGFDLHRLHEAFRFGIIVGIAAPTHRSNKIVLGEKIAIEERGILRASIRVMDAARRWLSPFDCRLKCRGHTTSNCRFLKHAYLHFLCNRAFGQ